MMVHALNISSHLEIGMFDVMRQKQTKIQQSLGVKPKAPGLRQQCSINELCTTTRGSTALTVSNSWLLPPVHSPLFHLVMSVHDTLENDKCCLLGGTSVYSWVGPASTVGWGQHLQLGGPASIVGWGQPLQLGGTSLYSWVGRASTVGWDQPLQLGGTSLYSWVGRASTVGWGQCLQLGGASLYSWDPPARVILPAFPQHH